MDTGLSSLDQVWKRRAKEWNDLFPEIVVPLSDVSEVFPLSGRQNASARHFWAQLWAIRWNTYEISSLIFHIAVLLWLTRCKSPLGTARSRVRGLEIFTSVCLRLSVWRSSLPWTIKTNSVICRVRHGTSSIIENENTRKLIQPELNKKQEEIEKSLKSNPMSGLQLLQDKLLY